jgi:hypothetical protein
LMLDAVSVAELKPLSMARVPDEIIRRLKLVRMQSSCRMRADPKGRRALRLLLPLLTE